MINKPERSGKPGEDQQSGQHPILRLPVFGRGSHTDRMLNQLSVSTRRKARGGSRLGNGVADAWWRSHERKVRNTVYIVA
jgi:hypothetical protein